MIVRHPRKMLEVKRLIERDGFNIPQGAVKTTKSGIAVQRLANGNYKGKYSTATFRIAHGKKVFFVRYSKIDLKEHTKKHILARKLFENKKINGYTVRVLMPHILYGKPKQENQPKSEMGPTFTVTDYLDASQGTLYKDYFDQNYATKDPKLTQELENLEIARKKIEIMLGVEQISFESRDRNMFVVPGKKVLWLFDFE
ncbi:MAG: hypothetical protein WC915_02540 [archaeon]|jgi:co-chaperonin GroES (HSP10)